jgi:hypothetical protein
LLQKQWKFMKISNHQYTLATQQTVIAHRPYDKCDKLS